MARRCALVALSLLALMAGQATAALTKVGITSYTAYQPTFEKSALLIHRDLLYQGYLSRMNSAAAAGKLGNNRTLTNLVASVGRGGLLGLSNSMQEYVRENGGGAWNHALFFKTLAPTSSQQSKYAASASSQLQAAIEKSFGGVGNMTAAMRSAAAGVFGSGWVWVVANRGPLRAPLSIVVTQNEDNTLMRLNNKYNHEGSMPIMGVDVWEHAYYPTAAVNRRLVYVDSLLKNNVNWAKVSENFNAAMTATTPGKVEAAGAIIAQN